MIGDVLVRFNGLGFGCARLHWVIVECTEIIGGDKWWKRVDFDKIVSRGTLIIENEKSVFYNFGGFLVILL